MRFESKSAVATRGGLTLANLVWRFVRTIFVRRDLLIEMVLRDLRSGHASHAFGALWQYIHPLIVVLTFMLIFGVVIGARLSVSANFPGDYTSYILTGLVPWLLTAYLLGRGPSVFTGNANLVKQVVFPIEILPVSAVVVGLAIYVPAFLLLIGYKAIIGGGLSAMVLFAPAVIFLHAVMAIGIVMALSVVTPFVRDVRELVTVYTAVSMYVTPAIYLPDWVPPMLRPILYLNPFSYVVWVYQDVFFFGYLAHPFAWVIFSVMGIASFIGGLTLMMKFKPYLGNVL